VCFKFWTFSFFFADVCVFTFGFFPSFVHCVINKWNKAQTKWNNNLAFDFIRIILIDSSWKKTD
jgi:hypothetical protein